MAVGAACTTDCAPATASATPSRQCKIAPDPLDRRISPARRQAPHPGSGRETLAENLGLGDPFPCQERVSCTTSHLCEPWSPRVRHATAGSGVGCRRPEQFQHNAREAHQDGGPLYARQAPRPTGLGARFGLRALRPWVTSDSMVLVQRAVALSRDGRVVHEHVGAAAVLRGEAGLLAVGTTSPCLEPLSCSYSWCVDPARLPIPAAVVVSPRLDRCSRSTEWKTPGGVAIRGRSRTCEEIPAQPKHASTVEETCRTPAAWLPPAGRRAASQRR